MDESLIELVQRVIVSILSKVILLVGGVFSSPFRWLKSEVDIEAREHLNTLTQDIILDTKDANQKPSTLFSLVNTGIDGIKFDTNDKISYYWKFNEKIYNIVLAELANDEGKCNLKRIKGAFFPQSSSEDGANAIRNWLDDFITKNFNGCIEGGFDKFLECCEKITVERISGYRGVYNSDKLGIESIEKDGNDKYTIKIFKTNYFTAQFIKTIYQRLYKLNPAVFKDAINLGDVKKFKLFNCFNGAIGAVIDYQERRPDYLNRILLVQRGKNVANKLQWSLSFDEGIKYCDIVDEGGNPIVDPLVKFVNRSLVEELGYRNRVEAPAVSLKKLGRVINKNRFEMDFLFFVKIPCNEFTRLKLYMEYARDTEEIERYKIIPLNMFSFKDFLEKTKNETIMPELAVYMSEYFKVF